MSVELGMSLCGASHFDVVMCKHRLGSEHSCYNYNTGLDMSRAGAAGFRSFICTRCVRYIRNKGQKISRERGEEVWKM